MIDEPTQLPDDPYEAIQAILQMRVEGALDAELEGKHSYALLLYEIYPNGTSSDTFIEDQGVCREIGKLTGLGPPTDPQGWGVWDIATMLQEGRLKPPQED